MHAYVHVNDMADCIVGRGAVAVHAGGRVFARAAGGGGEFPVQDAELGSDPAKDTLCEKLHALGLKRNGERTYQSW
jgi:hypothetical protein